ncbi:MAG TPA: glyoxalase/bleomycin resistance/extradiol dioxygenase family protein [Planctomycetaceae bacterium]|nr:glyoxalase/bleomycin resistance/extradiol dioxygenase family protein [Blastopirellula sp.]HAY78802.1 glyoxalase/bleomycin resistance/extradiol dioxygenase family protein [Planctomycetaceae bacterium]
MEIHSVLETCLYVDDLAAAEHFYGVVLNLPVVSACESRHVFFRCGDQMLLIFDPTETSRPDGELPPHGTTGAGHIALSVTPAELPDWQTRLADFQVEIEHVEIWPNQQRSLYFRDPAGNSVELASPQIWGIDQPHQTTH